MQRTPLQELGLKHTDKSTSPSILEKSAFQNTEGEKLGKRAYLSLLRT